MSLFPLSKGISSNNIINLILLNMWLYFILFPSIVYMFHQVGFRKWYFSISCDELNFHILMNGIKYYTIYGLCTKYITFMGFHISITGVVRYISITGISTLHRMDCISQFTSMDLHAFAFLVLNYFHRIPYTHYWCLIE